MFGFSGRDEGGGAETEGAVGAEIESCVIRFSDETCKNRSLSGARASEARWSSNRIRSSTAGGFRMLG